MSFSRHVYFNKRRSYRHDPPSDKILDKDFQSILYPFHLIHKVLLYPKFNIKRDVILPNSKLTKICSFIVVLFSISFLIGDVYSARVAYHRKTNLKTAYVITCCDLFIYGFGLIAYYINNVTKSRRNVSIILKLQAIHRFLGKKHNFNYFTVRNWICLFFFLVLRISCLLYSYFLYQYSIYSLFRHFAVTCFEINIIYASRLLKWLTTEVELWNDQARNLAQIDPNNKPMFCKRMFKAYTRILECYDIYKSTFQIMVRRYHYIYKNNSIFRALQ